MTTVAKRVIYAVDGVDVASFALPLSDDDVHRTISLTILKELRTMATISDQALADLQTAAQANADRDAALGAKVDAAVQLITDLKAAVAGAGTSADPVVQQVIALLNGATAQSISGEDKLDAAVAP
jgi:hypothetical protein